MREVDVVRLTRDYEGFPAGMIGTIVSENDLHMFDVEFQDDEDNYYEPILVPNEYLVLVQAWHPATLLKYGVPEGTCFSPVRKLSRKTIIKREPW